MITKKTLRRTLLLMIALVVCALLMLVLPRSEQFLNKPSKKQEKRLDSPLNISGLSFSNYHGECLASRVSVDTFKVRPRSWKIFHIRSVNEAILQNAHFELFEGCVETTQEAGTFSLSGGLSESFSGLVKMRGVGRITRALMDKVVIKNHRDSRLTFLLVARSGEFDIQKKSIVFNDAMLQHPTSGRSIRTEVVIWEEAEQRFHIPGSFLLRSSKSTEKREKAYLDVDFQIIYLQ